jgi:urease accessory protein UreE
MTIVENVVSATDLGAGRKQYRNDTITLTWEERRRGHGRRTTDQGTGFAISLPAGTLLKQDDRLILDEERIVVSVVEAKEPVYVLRPQSVQEWAYYAYHVGNRHQAVMIGKDELVFLRSPAVKSLLDQLRAKYAEGERPFTAALVNVGH